LPLDSLEIHLRFKELEIVAPMFLGVVHRRVSTLYQGFRILSVSRVDADADAAIDMQIQFPPMEWGPLSARRILLALLAASSGRVISESRITNSSPPWRLTVSDLRTLASNRLETD
jgi:hypothetical protein